MGSVLVLVGLFIIAVIINKVTMYLEGRETEQRLGKHPPKPVTPIWHQYADITPFIPIIDKRAYLASPQWNTRRKLVLTRDHYTCRQCGINTVPLEVHHLHYRNLGNEPLTDLVALCRDCHQSIHDIYGYDLYQTFPIQEYQ